MSMRSRLKLWAGILVVVVILGLLTLLFNHRQSSVSSSSAVVRAHVAQIASAFGGVVTAQYVEEGQHVRAGDKLFTVTSSTLQQAVGRGAKPESNIAFDLDTAGATITYKAVTDGYITDMAGAMGTYVNDGAPLATLVSNGDRTVLASYRLAAVDYGRVVVGGVVNVLLPNNSKLTGTVKSVSVTVEGDHAVTLVTVACPGLDDASLGILANQGTPVVAVMSLRDDGPLSGPTQSLLGFLTKIGLR